MRDWRQYFKGSFKASKHGINLRIKHHLGKTHSSAFEAAKELNKEQFKQRQEQALIRQIEHAVKNVPYYRINKSKYLHEGIPGQLEELPTITKQELKSQMELFYADAGVGRYRISKTSGTSGTPLKVHKSFYTHALFQAGLERQREQFGLYECDRKACLTGFFTPAGPSEKQLWWRDFVGNRIFLNIYQLKDANAEAFSKLICKYQPKAIFGYASTVYLLANLLQRNQTKIPSSVKVALTTSEVLYPKWRTCIESTFNAPTADQYGSIEGQCLVTQCPHEKMHINPEHGIIEILDDNGIVQKTSMENLYERL